MIFQQNQVYQVGPHQLQLVQNLLSTEHRGHEVNLMQTSSGKRVVCKVATSAEAAEQMQHEQDVITLLRDVPGIVQSLGLYPYGEHFVLLLEYLDATHAAHGRLHVTMTPEQKQANWPLTVQLFYEGLRLLQAAHQHNIIHGDIKLQNFLCTANLPPQIYLIDWDHSLLLPTQPPPHTPAEGTPQFMAPEQVLHHPIDARTDLYSLGVSCLALLYGADVTPRYHIQDGKVVERSNEDIVKALKAGETIKLNLLPAPTTELEATLQTVWRSLVAADPAQRPVSAAAILQSLPPLPAIF